MLYAIKVNDNDFLNVRRDTAARMLAIGGKVVVTDEAAILRRSPVVTRRDATMLPEFIAGNANARRLDYKLEYVPACDFAQTYGADCGCCTDRKQYVYTRDGNTY